MSSQIDKLYFFMNRLRPIPLKTNEDGVERVTGWHSISIKIVLFIVMVINILEIIFSFETYNKNSDKNLTL